MKYQEEPVFVTRPSLPPLEDYIAYLKEIWDNRILTNNGPFHQKFEKELAGYLGVKYLSLFTNGTLALLTALKVLKVTGEVITTPFSFVATTHSLWWNNIKPVFADILPDTLNIDPEKVERAITKKTSAILPVHIFGNPCKVEQLKKIADKHNLKLIYDAAHAFGTRIEGCPVLNFGDMSILSFHATKLFNTCEGGAIISRDEETKKRVDLMRNFGFEDQLTIKEPGINGKMNELQAAFGLLQLKQIDILKKKCESIADEYRNQLEKVNGIFTPPAGEEIEKNWSFFPILINPSEYGRSRDDVFKSLKKKNIYCRRYFFPLISNIRPYNNLVSSKAENLKVANSLSEQILCLPIYPDLPIERVKEISRSLKI